MYEHRNEPLLPWPLFKRRAVRHAGGALVVLLVVLLLGMAGLVFVSAVGYMGAPWLHRMLHRLHLEAGGAGMPRDRAPRPPAGENVTFQHPDA